MEGKHQRVSKGVRVYEKGELLTGGGVRGSWQHQRVRRGGLRAAAHAPLRRPCLLTDWDLVNRVDHAEGDGQRQDGAADDDDGSARGRNGGGGGRAGAGRRRAGRRALLRPAATGAGARQGAPAPPAHPPLSSVFSHLSCQAGRRTGQRGVCVRAAVGGTAAAARRARAVPQSAVPPRWPPGAAPLRHEQQQRPDHPTLIWSATSDAFFCSSSASMPLPLCARRTTSR